MTKDFCNKCGACCKNIKADFEAEILYWDDIQPLTDEFRSMLIPNDNGFYVCRFLKENICTNQAKPEICINYPSSPFVNLPEGCGYYGDIFMKREKVQQKIRKLKEEIMHYEALIASISDKQEQKQYQKIIYLHQKYIDKYKEYGSQDW